MRRFSLSSISLTGTSIFIIFVLAALFAGVLAPYSPDERFDPYASPSKEHLLGTNDIGNDILSELIFGTRVSLVVGLLTSFLATGLGVIIGMTSGYFRGILDETLMAVTDVFLMIPRIPLVIILAVFLRPSYWIIILVLGLVWWTTTARVVRSKTLQVRETGFVESSRSMGFSHAHIIFSEIFPNIIFIVVPKFMLTVASAMISEASLSFLGLGDPTAESWGMMIRYAFERGGFIRDMWWWYVAPGAAVTLCVLSIVLISFSLENRRGGSGREGMGFLVFPALSIIKEKRGM
ncbi:MAG: ABC transporter permease [Spirochaetia bacterium]